MDDNFFIRNWRGITRYAVVAIVVGLWGTAVGSGSDKSAVIPLLIVAWLFLVVDLAIFFELRPLWRWLGLLVWTAFVGATYFYIDYMHRKVVTEDLRASFQFSQTTADSLEVRYIFLNLGNQAALIRGLALFDIAAIMPTADPMENTSVCDRVPLATIQMQGFFGNFIRFAVVPGATGAVLHPVTVSIEGETGQPKAPVVVDAGHTRILTATFKLGPEDKEKDTRIICPIVDTSDVNNQFGTAICRGASTSIGVTPDARISTFRDLREQQVRLLPHTNGLPTCPVTSAQ